MELQQLRYVIALSQELHFQRAARKAHVTQPTLSQGLKNLEKELGTVLFERASHLVRLTDAGKKFLPHAVMALDHIQKGTLEIQKGGVEAGGTVRLGVIPTICPYLMPEVILRLKETAPRLVLELYEETTSVLLDHLKTGNIDLAILAMPVRERGIVEEPLLSEPFYLAVARHHRLASRKSVTQADIADEKLLVLQEGHCFGKQTLAFCKVRRKDAQVIFQGSSLTSVIKLASSGEGVTFVPRMAVDRIHNPDIVYLPFSPVMPTRAISAIWRFSAPLLQAQRVLIETARQVLKNRAS